MELAFYWDGRREEERRKHTWLSDKHVDYHKVMSLIEKRNGVGEGILGMLLGGSGILSEKASGRRNHLSKTQG